MGSFAFLAGGLGAEKGRPSEVDKGPPSYELVSGADTSMGTGPSDYSTTTDTALIPLPLPVMWAILQSSGEIREAPLSVITTGNRHYLIKVKDLGTLRDVVVFFVRGGETAELEVSTGTYLIYYATGETWYGTEQLFGPETRYYKADDIFPFYEDDGYINGWTLELYAQPGGNLDTITLDAMDF